MSSQGAGRAGRQAGRQALRGENEMLRERITGLSEAVLRVSGTLHLDTVLRAAVDGARALTGARCGVVTTVDHSGRTEDFVTSGFTREQDRQLADVRALAAWAEPAGANGVQRTALRHGDRQVGDLLLAAKADGGEFTGDDREVLALFAAQAAAAVANARAHRDVQRARADLEALLETSPVGVLVFDAKSAVPVSLNREAQRIVSGLSMPDRNPEELLKVLTCRFASGREVALDAFPLAQELRAAKNVVAEEIVLSVPDGRSVKTLINATPVRAADGTVESVVVTMQDMAPLEELVRMRAEFLGMVSHELRAPLTSIKGSTTTVLGALPALDAAEMLQFFRIIDEQADHMRGLIGDLLDAGRIHTGTLSVAPEPAEVSGLVEQARNTFLSGGSRHTVLLDLPHDLPRVMADRQRIVQVLNNLLSNAARHSPESAPIRVAAARDGVHVAISVSDRGPGVPPERLPHLFRQYTGIGVDGQHGLRRSGLGLAISKGLVEAHGGRIWAASGGPGQGAQFTFTVPVAEEADAARGRPRSRRRDGERTPILVVDDDPQTLRYVRDVLADADYSPIVTGDHRELSRIIRTEKPRLVLLDLMLSGADGIALMNSVPELADLPVIFISGYGRDETVARALESGAADYVVKPFSPTELTARIRAALRRHAEPEAFVLRDLAIHYERRLVTVNGRPVPLTVTEYELLRLLSLSPGRVTTYESLIRNLWHDPDSGDASLVRTFVKNLRRKLGDDPARPVYVVNERGVGYRMPAPETR